MKHNSKRPDIESKGDFLYLFFELMKRGKYDVTAQINLFNQLNKLVSESSRIKIYCSSKRWLVRLLDFLPSVEDAQILGFFPLLSFSPLWTEKILICKWEWLTFINYIEEVVQLIKTLGRFSISAEEIKRIFRLMNYKEKTFKADRLPVLLDILQYTSQRSGPDTFYDFNGIDSVWYFSFHHPSLPPPPSFPSPLILFLLLKRVLMWLRSAGRGLLLRDILFAFGLELSRWMIRILPICPIWLNINPICSLFILKIELVLIVLLSII